MKSVIEFKNDCGGGVHVWCCIFCLIRVQTGINFEENYPK